MPHRWKTSGEFQHFNAKETLEEIDECDEEDRYQSSDDLPIL